MALDPIIVKSPGFIGKRTGAGSVPTLGETLAEGVGKVADTLHKIDLQDREVEDRIAASEFRIREHEQQQADDQLALAQNAKLISLRGKLQASDAERRGTMAAGGAGFHQGLMEEVDTDLAEFDKGFGDNVRVRDRFRDNIATVRAHFDASAQIVEQGARAKYAADNFGTAQGELLNQMRLNPTLDNMQTSELLLQQTVSLLPLPEAERHKALRDGKAALTEAFAEGSLEKGDIATVETLFQKGAFSRVLTPDQHERLGKRIVLTKEQEARRAELVAHAAQKSARDQLQLLKAQSEAGIDVPNAAAIIENARAAGVAPDAIFDAGVVTQRLQFNKAYLGMSPEALQGRADMLEAKVASGKASAVEQMEFQHIGKVADERRNEAASKNKELWDSGAPGRMQILRDMRSLSPMERARQADKFSPEFRMAAGLNAKAQAYAINGMDARKAKPQLVPEDKARAAFDKYLSIAGRYLGTAELANVRDGAMNIYAGTASESGAEVWNEERFLRAVSIQLGATKQGDFWVGGLGTYRGHRVILPATKTSEGLEATIAKHDFGNARYANKVVAAKSDILRYFRPEYAGARDGKTLYRFFDGRGNALIHAKGSAYIMEVLP